MNKITSIEIQKKNIKRYSIFIDESFAFGINEDVLVEFRLKVGDILDPEFIKTVLIAAEQNKANNCALKFLGFKSRSIKEIVLKLSQKGYEEDIINNTIQYLKKYNYVDDAHYAQSFCKDKINMKKLGQKRLKTELQAKGIDQSVISEVLEDLLDEEKEYENALLLAKKKLSSSYKNDEFNAQYRKLSGFLSRKGYSFNLIAKVLEKLLKKSYYE